MVCCELASSVAVTGIAQCRAPQGSVPALRIHGARHRSDVSTAASGSNFSLSSGKA